MLLSMEKRFIFIHIPKSAGSSISHALTPYSLKPRQTPYRRLLSHLPVPEDPEKAWLRGHDKAWWLKLKLPAEIFDGFLKFAVVRNPFDYAVSYYHSVRMNPRSSRHAAANAQEFGAFLRDFARKDRLNGITQTAWITDRAGKRIIIDRVLRYESLDADMAALMRDLGVEAQPIPRLNASRHEPYRTYYSDADRALAERLFARDLEMLGYAF